MKVLLYVAVEHGSIHGKAIGVAVSDSPTGPFKDAKGSAIITNDLTTKYTKISWDDIDPTVIIDDDKQAYLYWGNTQCYYVKLKENMIDISARLWLFLIFHVVRKHPGYIKQTNGIIYRILPNFLKK